MDPLDNQDSGRDQELIEKIISSWDAQEDELLALTTEVDAWLTSRNDASVSPGTSIHRHSTQS